MSGVETEAERPKRPIWSGRISIGLVNVSVKLYTMIRDKTFPFRFLRKNDACPLGYERVCTLDGEVVEWKEVVRGYEVRDDEFVTFTNEELKALRPESDKRIRIDKFINILSVDPVYFDRSYILAPDKSKEEYSLLLTAMQKMGMAGVGKFTLKNKEHLVLLHQYSGALLLTTLRYANEVANPLSMEELRDLKQPSREELDLAIKIIENLSGDFNIREYKDTFRDKVMEAVETKMKGETIAIERPQKEEAKELMVALQETLEQLQKK